MAEERQQRCVVAESLLPETTDGMKMLAFVQSVSSYTEMYHAGGVAWSAYLLVIL